MVIQSPLKNSEFRKLFTAQVIALVGTGLTTIALTLLAYDLVGGNAGIVLGTALAFKMTAYVVFAPIVGGLAHRLPRKPLLIALDIVRAAIVLAMPFVTAVWQIYVLIFLLNLFSAGFKPVFQATIPDLLPDEQQYTRALSYSRLAYDLENLLSPTFAGLALLVFSYDALFQVNSIAFLVSAVLIFGTALPATQRVDRLGGVWGEISFGVRSYMRTPRLRALLILYLGVAGASAMVIVNTVVYVREYLGGSETDTALAFAAAGGGSMIAALLLPKILDRIPDRPVMLAGGVLMGFGLLAIYSRPVFAWILPIWCLIGMGWSLVQTPAGRVVNRSSSAADRPAYFSAQFALSHGCWLLAYPIAGQLGARIGIETAALIFGGAVLLFTIIAARAWPSTDAVVLEHTHETENHQHEHVHDEHHRHDHDGTEAREPHSHAHGHESARHSHPFVIDDHHAHWPAV
ncbi:MAG: MFS transporter [Pseudomonadota bacterium]|nr:MFS transporter [Pseudomonadota bacterium]